MELADLRGWMRGEDCVVVGCGPSAMPPVPPQYPRAPLGNYRALWTVVCNRSVIFAQPDFAVCVEPSRNKPTRDITAWKAVIASSPLVIFSHIARPHPRCVLIGSKDVLEWMAPDGVDYSTDTAMHHFDPGDDPDPVLCAKCGEHRNWHEPHERLRLAQSPFYAAAVAAFLGFETIGIIGVDMTPDRYDDGEVERANKAWGRLNSVVAGMGSRLVNLSPESRLVAVEQGKWEEVRGK